MGVLVKRVWRRIELLMKIRVNCVQPLCQAYERCVHDIRLHAQRRFLQVIGHAPTDIKMTQQRIDMSTSCVSSFVDVGMRIDTVHVYIS